MSFTLLFVAFICGWPTPARKYHFCIFIFRPIQPLTATITEGLVFSLHSGFTAWTYGVGMIVPMHMDFGDGHRSPVCRGQEEIENYSIHQSALFWFQMSPVLLISPGLTWKNYIFPFRVYLKTVNTPKQRVFSTCWAPFFLAIRRVFLQKNGFIRRKTPRRWSYFRFSDRP